MPGAGTLLDEHLRIAGRTTSYESIDRMQADFDAYLHHDNHERPHQSRMMDGRTPTQRFDAGKTQRPDLRDVLAEAA